MAVRIARSVRLALLRRWGWSPRGARLAEHWLLMLWEQIIAVVPITVQLILTIAIFFGRNATNPGELAWGLACAVLGLTLFVDALRMAVMPLGEMLGEELPKRLPLPLVLLVACGLGILVTYAEPAIASIRPLARLVSKKRTPYLHLLLNELQEPLIFSIGLGVGVAAILGTLRFVRGWSLKPLIACTLGPAIACAIYMQWGNPDLSPLIGLAWDCGAITTGPVTVPILLALGIGVMKTSKEKTRAKELLSNSIVNSSGQQPTLDGFGIVTLASVLPVLAVEILAIVSSFIYTKEDILNAADKSELEAVTDVSPVREILFAIRAILPLNVALLLLVLFVLRAPLPPLTVFVPVDPILEDAAADGDAKEVQAPADQMSILPTELGEGGAGGAGVSVGASSEEADAAAAAASGGQSMPLSPDEPARPPPTWFQRNFPHGVGALLLGILTAQVGLILFNLGLTYGFTSIGDQVGQLLPASFLATEDVADSPVYSFSGGVALTFITVYILGFLATRAEPALNVLGRTVEKLSHGSFSKNLLIYAVSLGVGAGMATGATKILFEIPVIYFILAKYGVAVLLTSQANEDFTNIAWDSAGVTTGPVTVPFVLSIGIGFNKAANSPEGFGILTCASVAPIITVLLADSIRRFVVARRAARSAAIHALPAGAAVVSA
jgi:hypothetical protein